MLGHIRRRHIVTAALIASVTPGLGAQTPLLRADSLRLRYMRIRTQATDSCRIVVSTSGSMDIRTHITPANARRWIDTATAYASAVPHRAKGQEIRFAWIPLTLGISRTITDRYDAFSFAIGGHGIPLRVTEIPRIAKLLESAAAQTLQESHMPGGCPTAPDS